MHRHDVLYLFGVALVGAIVYAGGQAGLYTQDGMFIVLLLSLLPACVAMLIAMFRGADIDTSRHMGRAWLGATLLWVMLAAISYDVLTMPRAVIAALSLYLLVSSLLARRKRLSEHAPT